jgi:hypothetical protein
VEVEASSLPQATRTTVSAETARKEETFFMPPRHGKIRAIPDSEEGEPRVDAVGAEG